MARKESTIVYDKHVDICSEFLSAEQFGRLMFALIKGEDPDFGDDQMLAMAFAFISLQKDMDDKKYEERCKKNRANGKLGGRPKKNEKEKPKKANGFFENPNDNENENDNDNDNDDENDNEKIQQSVFFGSLNNVELTELEYENLKQTYEKANKLIDKVSRWINKAKNDVPDHYALCLKFAENEDWPKRKEIEPSKPIVVEDPLSEEEQRERVADMRAKLNTAIGSG